MRWLARCATIRGARPFAALEARFARAVLPAGDEPVVAAVSGGRDSAALAALARATFAQTATPLVFAHVNHGIRARSLQDEAVVLALGAALGVRVVTRALAPGSGSSEERLREGRYAALVDVARTVGARRIFTGHHARDQAETVLLALLRGSGPGGLAGMAPVRELAPGIALERPLLDVEPELLAAYGGAEHLPYVVDESNADLGYRRNAVRAALVPLREAFPHLDAAVARCATIVREERSGGTRARLRADVRAALAASGVGTRDVSFERLDAAARALERGAPGRHFLRRGVEMVVE